MTDENEILQKLQKAVIKLKMNQLELDTFKKQINEPIAIIGLGCRFPGGANNPDDFWDLLKKGYDGITEVPKERWDINAFYDPDPEAPGKMYCRSGGFLNVPIEMFDASFFGISPREAEFLDPQQRLILEVAWEALEIACINPLSLKGTQTGVFIGFGSRDFADTLSNALQAEDINAYFGTGNSGSALAGRLSYFLGARGPSISVDTACSSSLVSLHLACKSLKARECNLALAGGVNILLNPAAMINCCKSHTLSKDGRCKTFDESADGYVRSEGCGLIILKRLSDAILNQDPIFGIIRSTEVNQDGSSSGLMVPNADAQIALVKEVLKKGNLRPDDIDYIEAHGTGTSLGDPIEFAALSANFSGRKGNPLWLGSVKTNIGHLEAAAGIAGVIKTVLALNHEALPAHLHFNHLNSRISLESIPAKIPLHLTAWPKSSRPRLAGVSSFGFTGTNAHAIIEEAPSMKSKINPLDRPFHILTLSAQTQPALDELITKYASSLPEEDIADIAYSANTGRAHFTNRIALIAATRDELQQSLLSGNYLIKQTLNKPKLTFIFTGAKLEPTFNIYPAFKDAYEKSNGLYDYAIFELWKSWGILPDFVAGTGVGDYIAACASGLIGLEDCLLLIENKDLPDKLAEIAKDILYKEPSLGLISSWTGEIIRKGSFNSDYWKPHENIHHLSKESLIVSAPGSWHEILENLVHLYLNGYPVDWEAFDKPFIRKKISLPTYPFQRTRHWPELLKTHKLKKHSNSHPLLGEGISTPTGELVFRNELNLEQLSFLKDHQVFNTVLFPAAGYLELFLAAGKNIYAEESFLLGDIVIEQPMAFQESQSVPLSLVANFKENGYSASIYSHSMLGWISHAHCYVRHVAKIALPPLDWENLLLSCQNSIDIETFYRTLDQHELHYGSQFQTLKKIWLGQNELIGELEGQEIISLIDGCFQSISFFAGQERKDKSDVFLPFRINSVVYLSPVEHAIRVHAKLIQISEKEMRCDINIYSKAGKPLLKIEGFQVLKTDREHFKELLEKQGSKKISSFFYQTAWVVKPLEEIKPISNDPWLIVSGENEDLSYLELSEVRRVDADADKIIDALSQNQPLPSILWFVSGENALNPILKFVQALSKTSINPAIFFVTRGIQSLDTITDLKNSTFNGFYRTLKLEMPNLDICHIDLSKGDKLPLEELRADDKEDQVSYRQGMRYAARLLPQSTIKYSGKKLVAPLSDGFSLELLGTGEEKFYLKPKEVIDPKPNEITVEVKAAALNFYDVLASLGIEFRSSTALGGECSGVITNIGSDVVGFKRGDTVVGFAPGAMCSHLNVPYESFFSFPAHINFIEAAGIPVVFTTAYHGLVNLAKLKKREKILIHAAAGGVGLAAIQIAKLTGAEIYATAGSEEKRAYLRSLGIKYIYNSRTLDFAEEILKDTQGEGIDVVLNSLTGEGFIDKTLSACKGNVRFVEIGKRNIWTRESIHQVKPSCEYHILALDEMLENQPLVVLDLLKTILDLLKNGKLKPLPYTAFDISEAQDAFDYLQKAKNIGKVVITIPDRQRLKIDPAGSYLVTGGFGSLGFKVAQWLADKGAKHLVLAGRTVDEDLSISNATVERVAIDVSRKDEVDLLFIKFGTQWPELKGIIHAAGILDDGIISSQDWPRFLKVYSSKVEGSWNLHEASLDKPLDFFVLFSSAASSIGSPGQINYASANAFMDALAFYRREGGLPGQSISWGPWAEIGLAVKTTERHKTRGVIAFKPEEGIKALEVALNNASPHLTLLNADWKTFPYVTAFLSEVISDRSIKIPRLLKVLQEALPSQRQEILIEFLQKIVGRILGATSIDVNQGFFEAGMDSLMTEELHSQLQKDMGSFHTFPSTIAFDYPSISKLVGYFEKYIFPEMGMESPTQKITAASKAIVQEEEIAIIGMGCRFPGGANSPQMFWSLLEKGYDGISEIPANRWDIDSFYDADAPGKMYVRTGGFLKTDVDTFDAQFFGISPREVEFMDPQQRLLLEVTWEALENACIDPVSLNGTEGGVFIGMGSHDYSDLMTETASLTNINVYQTTGNSASILAGRVSYFFGLQGPSLAIDTACSSSLVALHTACKSLMNGECNLAITGGVNLMLNPAVTISMCQGSMLARDGYCKTFDADADGYARGEGCGVVILKRLSDAKAEGDSILAVIKTSEVNQDGATSGITVPNGEAQNKLIRQALAHARLDPLSIDYIETHGTGTSLGDPIEVGALSKVFAGRNNKPLWLGTVKTNIGHLEAAAGVAGLIKTVLALNHEAIPPHLHFKSLNPRISLDSFMAKLPLTLTPWKRSDVPRIAGVSSFGFSGTNAHVIISEGPLKDQFENPQERPAHLVTFSAKDQKALNQIIENYIHDLPNDDIGNIAFSANTGRSHFAYRAAVRASSRDELLSNLQMHQFEMGAISEKMPKLLFVFSGKTNQAHEFIDPAFTSAFEQSSKMGDFSISELLKSWGILPDYVTGEDVEGEITAAISAGILTLEDGLKLKTQKDNPEKFLEVAQTISYYSPRLGFLSRRTKELLGKEGMNSDYWRQQNQNDVSQPISYPSDFLPVFMPKNWSEMLALLATLYLKGFKIDWKSFDKPFQRKKVMLPTYPFQRIRYWFESPNINKLNHSQDFHPLLGRLVPSPSDEKIYVNEIDLKQLPFLKDHKIFNTILFPAAGYLEMFLTFGTNVYQEESFLVEDLVIDQPMAIQGSQSVSIALMANFKENGYSASIHSDSQHGWISHAHCVIHPDSKTSFPPLDWENLLLSCQNPIDMETFYRTMEMHEVDYGDQFQTLKKLWVSHNELIAELEGQEIIPLIDGCFQATSFFAAQDKKDYVFLPFRINTVVYLSLIEHSIRIHAKLIQITEREMRCDINVYSKAGKPLLKIEGFQVLRTDQGAFKKLLEKQSSKEISSFFYQTAWIIKPLEEIKPVSIDQWLIVSSENEDISDLELSKTCRVDPEKAIDTLTQNQPPSSILWFVSGENTLNPILKFVQALSKTTLKPSIIFVTRGIQALGTITDLKNSTFNGFYKTLKLELPNLNIRHIDLSQGDKLAFEELGADDKEDQISYLQGRRYAARLLPQSSIKYSGKRLIIPPADGYELEFSGDSDEKFYLKPKDVIDPKPNEITVEVKAAALNFHDVLISLGVDLGGSDALGAECSGIITNIGSEVRGFKPGDTVVGFATGSFCSHLNVPFESFFPLPDALSFNEGAAIPIVFSTAYQALINLAKLKRNDRILIHAAAGGVGLAAVQLAKQAGAEIYATAGSEEKRAYLRSLGIKHIYNSRTLDFADQILKDTQGEGIDVVLNSLTGEGFINKTLSASKENVRFVEIGKQNIWTQESMHQAKPFSEYHILALDEMLENQPLLVLDLFKTVLDLFKNGKLKPLPYTAFDISEAQDAFDYLQKAKNIGKVIITIPDRFHLKIDPAGSYLVTGGFGGLGFKVAQWLAEKGAKHLVLAGRTVDEDLSISNVSVERVAIDVSRKDEVHSLIKKFGAEWPELKGIIHAAGILDDGMISSQDWTRFETVYRPKVEGSWNLHEATLSKPLDFFILFSSVASSIGAPGQINYAAANSFMDGLAFYRREKGLPAQSISWGPWSEVGLAAQLTERHRARGLIAFKPDEGIKVLEMAMDNASPHLTLLNAEWKAFPHVTSFLSDVTTDRYPKIPLLLKILQESLPSQRQEILIEFLQKIVGRVLGTKSIDVNQGFFEAGMDSLMTKEFHTQLQKNMGSFHIFPSTIAFDYPSISKLVDYFEKFIFPEMGMESTTQKITAAPKAIVQEEEIAVIGMGCRFPGGANSPQMFWSLLEKGYDGISEIPANRWDIDSFYDADSPGKMYVRTGGFLKTNVDTFDAHFFGISPREVEFMDPQQRLLLEVTWEALENACIDPFSLNGTDGGVFIGISSHDYSDLMTEAASLTNVNVYQTTGNSASILAGRVSYLFGLQGPSLAIDTACSSSLVALHTACKSLKSGECNLAITGGVNIMLNPAVTISMCQGSMLARDGYCKTFDASADGYARGEGCGVVILKRLSDAMAEGDSILAVIKTSEVNQDGATSGMTVPNGEAQNKLIRQALARTKLDPLSIDYIETHGTGTSLGDPIEVGALSKVFAGRKDKPLWLGTVKTNIGHLEAAAGVAGLIKTVLALNHEAIPPHLHFKSLNPRISLDSFMAKIPLTLTPWKRSGIPRIAGVSSFGFSGTNAHVIISEGPLNDQLENPQERPAHLVTFSAKDQKALNQIIENYINDLPNDDIGHIAYSANTGRTHFAYRAVVQASSRNDLLANLKMRQFKMGEIPEKMPKLLFVFSNQKKHEHVPDDVSPLEQNLGMDDYSLVELFKSWGIAPDYVTGEDVEGEITAAISAGILTLEDGLKLKTQKDNPEKFLEVARTITYYSPRLGFLSSRTKEFLGTEGMNSDYWRQKNENDFSQAISYPSEFLTIVMPKNWSEMLALLANLYLQGFKIDWKSYDKPYRRKKVRLPTYPFQRIRYWFESPKVKKLNTSPFYHPLLGELIDIPSKDKVYKNELDLNFLPYLKEHRIFDNTLFPAAGFVELLLIAGGEIYKDTPLVVKNIVMDQPLTLQEDKTVPMVLKGEESENEYLATIYSENEKGWIAHSKGSIAHEKIPLTPQPDWENLRKICQQSINLEEFYSLYDMRGIHFGPSFRTLKNLLVGGDELIGEIESQEIIPLIDGCFQSLSTLFSEKTQDDESIFLPFRIARLVYFSPLELSIRIHAKKIQTTERERICDIDIYSKAGKLLLKIEGFSVRKTDQHILKQLIVKQAKKEISTFFYHTEWFLKSLDEIGVESKDNWLIVSERKININEFQFNDVVQVKPHEAIEALERHPSKVLWFIDGENALKPILDFTKSLFSIESKPRIFFVTHGVQPIDSITDLTNSTFNGFYKTLKLEMPNLICKHIDVSTIDQFQSQTANVNLSIESTFENLDSEQRGQRSVPIDFSNKFPLEELWSDDKEEQVAYREGKRYVSRLASYNAIPTQNSLKIDSEGSYLITGGFGGIGLRMAEWLLEKGAKHIVLAGRNISDHGLVTDATIETISIDISNEAEVKSLFERFGTDLPNIKGIIHAAGVIDDGVIPNQDWSKFGKVFSPKVLGSWNLHQASLTKSLDFFVSFSSIASTLGSPGQINYSAANSYLDALSFVRRKMNLPALSINWGPWSEIGMAAKLTEKHRSRGFFAMSPKDSLDAFELALSQPISNLMIADINWKSLPYHQTFLSQLLPKKQNEIPLLLIQLQEALPSERRDILLNYIQALVSEILRTEEFKLNQGFFDSGMDSLMAMELRNKLQSDLGNSINLAPTLAFDYSTINKLSDYLLNNLEGLKEEVKNDQELKINIDNAIINQKREKESKFEQEVVKMSLDEINKLLE